VKKYNILISILLLIVCNCNVFAELTGPVTACKCFAEQQPYEKITDLPLLIIKPEINSPDAPIALLISGDGGWYSFEQSITDKLAESGIISVGMDSRRYFWNRKTPEETASDVYRALKFYGEKWGRKKFVLIGYSLGAEIVPFIYNRLPDDLKKAIQSAVLLSPDTNTDFEIHISNMLGLGNKQNTYIVPDEIKKMHPLRTLLILGSGEKSKMPVLLEGSGAIIRELPGDHHYKFDIPLIVNTMKENKTL
jgi:type IV secretory pathway VirJ component